MTGRADVSVVLCVFTLGAGGREAHPTSLTLSLVAAHLWCTCLKLKFKN